MMGRKKKPGAQIRPPRRYLVSADLGETHYLRLQRIRNNHRVACPLDEPLPVSDVLRTAIDYLARELGLYRAEEE